MNVAFTCHVLNSETDFSRLIGKDSITDSIIFDLQLLSCSSWLTSTGPRPSRRRSAGCWLVLNRRLRGREMPQPKGHLSSVQVSGFPFLSFNVFVFFNSGKVAVCSIRLDAMELCGRNKLPKRLVPYRL